MKTNNKMKTNLHIILITLVALTFIGCADVKTDPATDTYLSGLLEGKNFFELRTELTNAQGKLSEDRFLYYKACCDNAFNDCPASEQCVEILFDKYKKQLQDSIISDLLAVKIRNHFRRFQYKETAETCQLLLTQYGNVLDSAKKADYKDLQLMCEKISMVKPTRINKQKDVEIASNRHPVTDFLMVPVKCNGINESFMFDTGANMSVITNTCANKMGMTVYELSARVETSTSHAVSAKIAVADSLYIGDILFENVVFLVMPLPSIPAIDLYIRGIIGFPEMNQMAEIHISKDGRMYIPQTSHEKQLKNMFLSGLEGLHPVIQLQSENDTLLLTFDTGANSTHLTKRYYDNHKEKIEEAGIPENSFVSGAGGSESVTQYVLKDFPYTIGAKNNVLPTIAVEMTVHNDDDFDGNVGQDMIIPFDKMILNFQYMYIDFE
jgi:predicted aspartyl protease